jgi:hypothetical protein
VETLARLLLLAFAHQIATYIEAGETDEGTDALLAWIKAQRLGGGDTTSPPPSAP